MSKTDYIKDQLEAQPWSEKLGQVQYRQGKRSKIKNKVAKKMK